MKYFYAFLLSAFCLSSQATHLMGGEITVAQLPNGQHLVSLLVYRDTVGIPMQSTATLEFQGPNGLYFTRNTAYDSIISGNLLPMYPYGVEVYLFLDTVSIPSPGQWHISWSDCCRNGAIQNLSNPLSDAMYLSTSLLVDSVAPNSTAFFLVPAAIYLPLNTAWQYNPLPFDPDGDSLVWTLDQPQKDFGTYCAGYSTPPATANNPLTLDSVTGTISWTANTVGHFVISILVDQYRNGTWIGEIRRDMQLIVVPAATGFPYWSSINNNAPRDTISLSAPASSPFNFEIVASHSDTSQALYMEAYSPLFQDLSNNVSFNVSSTGSGNDIKGNFQFIPSPSQINSKHLVVFRCSDQYFTTDQTLTIAVTSGIGLEEINQESATQDWKVAPNPFNDFISVSFRTSEAKNLNLRVLDVSGKELLNTNLKALYGSNTFWVESAFLDAGLYLLEIKGEEGLVHSEKLLKP